MILLISPAKTLDTTPCQVPTHTQTRFLEDTNQLVDILRSKNVDALRDLMKVSDNIAKLNVERYQTFQTPFSIDNAKQAVFTFKGDVYTGLNVDSFDKDDLVFAQKYLRILSGLYGLIRPMDLIQAYRLEMGTKLNNERGKNLYQFWGDKITRLINLDLQESKSKTVINLASNEYFKAIKAKDIQGDLYQVNFKENRNGKYKIIAFSAKKARGLMCNYIVKSRLTEVQELRKFNWDNYTFNESLSSEKTFIFTR